VGQRDAGVLGALRGSVVELRKSRSIAVRQAATRSEAMLGETDTVQAERVASPPAYRFGVSFGRVHMAGGDAELGRENRCRTQRILGGLCGRLTTACG
jgi:hypothetical protein